MVFECVGVWSLLGSLFVIVELCVVKFLNLIGGERKWKCLIKYIGGKIFLWC